MSTHLLFGADAVIEAIRAGRSRVHELYTIAGRRSGVRRLIVGGHRV